MRLFSDVAFRARALFGGDRMEAELDDELRFFGDGRASSEIYMLDRR